LIRASIAVRMPRAKERRYLQKMRDDLTLLKGIAAVGRDARYRRVVLREHSRRRARDVHAANAVSGVAAEGEQRHVAILAAHHLTEQICGAVIPADLPLGTEILQPQERKVRRVVVGFEMLKIAGSRAGQSHVMTGVAKSAAPEQENFDWSLLATWN